MKLHKLKKTIISTSRATAVPFSWRVNEIYWRLYIVWLALHWIKQINLFDKVWYKKKQYLVRNGVYPKQWRLSGLQNNDNGWVPRSECRKVKSLSNYIGSFRSGYRFYMVNWFRIWRDYGIENWMRRSNIWPKKF